MKTFEIYFNDLVEEAQDHLLKHFETTFEDENWETIPIVVIARDDAE